MRSYVPQNFEGTNTTLSVYKRTGPNSWVAVGDEFFVESQFGRPVLSEPALGVHPGTGEPWVAFFKNRDGEPVSDLVVMRYTTAPVG